MIIINFDKLPEVHQLKEDKIKQLCKISDIKVYSTGEMVNLSTGGFVLRGGIVKVEKEYESPSPNRG